MGDYVVRVHAVGGHGCQRNVKSGEKLAARCEHPDSCPDCISREYVEKLAKCGNQIKVASLTHWPADLEHYANAPLSEVRDDLVSHTRRGSF
jgi:hypothetical protein